MLVKRQSVMASTIPETETILLCDDEVGIRRLVSTILGMHGYHVLEAGSGKHAMLIAEAHSGPIHLLLSDVLMLELDGPGLAEQLRAVRPDVRVVFMSAEWVPDGVFPFVQKPFLPSALMSTIRDALAQPPLPLCHNP
jgi:two-component system, cell cycle sensor histidine kinase and response regulator CckA